MSTVTNVDADHALDEIHAAVLDEFAGKIKPVDMIEKILEIVESTGRPLFDGIKFEGVDTIGANDNRD